MAPKGPIPKQKDKLTGHRDNSLTMLSGGKQLLTPKPNSRWVAKTIKYWEEYWNSELASTAQAVDLPAFYRLFQFYDEVERANRVVARQGNAGLLAEGSKGQAVINPLIQLTLKLEEKILKLEQELGLTPLARQRLGIAFGEAQMGFQQLQQLLQQDDKQLVDPRILQLEEE
jgi:P27 family predicted phage terminase small subunit